MDAPSRAPTRGTTLPELAAGLLVLATLLGLAAPPLRGLVERSALAGAREALVGLVAETRTAAVVHGGAALHLRARPAEALVLAGPDTLRRLKLEEEFGVRLELTRRKPEATLTFDALGLGRIASESVTLRRGGASGGLVVSGYGRVRRW